MTGWFGAFYTISALVHYLMLIPVHIYIYIYIYICVCVCVCVYVCVCKREKGRGEEKKAVKECDLSTKTTLNTNNGKSIILEK